MENITAKVSCFARAYHARNNTTHIFADTAVGLMLGEDYDRIAQSMTQGIGFFLPGFKGSPEEGLRLIVDRQLSPSVLGRSAYCERLLENEARLGCRQIVVFASGYDTFAIRSGNASLSVYELDLPEVLADKKQRIENAGLTSRAIYVPCDLSDGSWKDHLFKARKASRCAACGLPGRQHLPFRTRVHHLSQRGIVPPLRKNCYFDPPL